MGLRGYGWPTSKQPADRYDCLATCLKSSQFRLKIDITLQDESLDILAHLGRE